MGLFTKDNKDQKFKAHVILIEGVKDSVKIINELSKLKLNVIVLLTTRFGKEQIEELDNVKVIDRLTTRESLMTLIKDNESGCVIDSSHAFATEISKNAMIACEKSEIAYLRYEKDEEIINYSDLIKVENLEKAAKKAKKIDGNIILTLGTKNVCDFISKIGDPERVIPRILPDIEVISKLLSEGVLSSNIVAIKGPFTETFYFELFKHYNAKALVTRNSGDVGATTEKILASKKLGMKIILIEKPKLDYKNVIKGITELIFAVGQIFSE